MSKTGATTREILSDLLLKHKKLIEELQRLDIAIDQLKSYYPGDFKGLREAVCGYGNGNYDCTCDDNGNGNGQGHFKDPNRFRDLTAIQATKRVLHEYGKPMHLNDIMRVMLHNGYDGQQRKKDLYRNIYSNMIQNHKDTFYLVPGKPATFGLCEWLGRNR